MTNLRGSGEGINPDRVEGWENWDWWTRIAAAGGVLGGSAAPGLVLCSETLVQVLVCTVVLTRW